MSIPKLAICLLLALSLDGMWVNVIHAQEASEEDLERAVMLFEESETAYNEGRFDEAAAMLRRAHELHPDPLLLFNLARALEGEGDLDGAIENYQGYLDAAPDAPDRGAVEARLDTLREQRDQLREAEAQEDVDDDDEVLAPVAEEDEGRSSVSLAPWLVAAGGLAVVGVGAVFGSVSQSKGEDAQNEPIQEDAQALHDQASSFATLANVFFIVGGLVVVGGVTWGVIDLLGDDDDEGAPDANLAIVPGGLVVDGTF